MGSRSNDHLSGEEQEEADILRVVQQFEEEQRAAEYQAWEDRAMQEETARGSCKTPRLHLTIHAGSSSSSSTPSSMTSAMLTFPAPPAGHNLCRHLTLSQIQEENSEQNVPDSLEQPVQDDGHPIRQGFC